MTAENGKLKFLKNDKLKNKVAVTLLNRRKKGFMDNVAQEVVYFHKIQ